MSRFIGARERLRLSELLGGVLRPGRGWRALDAILPDRPWALSTYGKSAFELAVIDAGLEGGRILMPAFISHDFVGVMQRHGITPVFADVDPDTAHLDPATCTPDVLSSVQAILLLHTFGLPADAAGFRTLADAHGLVLIEDCARALGGSRDGHPVGWYSDYAAYSLSKVAPIVRGGLISSRAPIRRPLPRSHADVSRLLNALMLVKVPGVGFLEGPTVRRIRDTPLYRTEVGLYDAPPIERLERSARFVLDAYLPHYEDTIRTKRLNAEVLRRRLEPMGFRFQSDTGGHLYTALGAAVPPGVDRNGLVKHIRNSGVNVFTLWGNPLGTSRAAVELWGADPTAMPVTTRLARELIHFPNSRFLDSSGIDRIVAACQEFLGP
jgi:dTDP-4-amino-4,6-dideoxygalactose transaminase